MNLKNNDTILVPVGTVEREKIDRNVLVWLNQFPGLPEGINKDMITPESHLLPDIPGMALSTITTAYVNRRYILGGYEADYNFNVVYRIKPGKDMSMSLGANELLNRLGEWASRNKPDLGEGIRVVRVSTTSPARLYSPYENGDEDHQITMKITYEVI